MFDFPGSCVRIWEKFWFSEATRFVTCYSGHSRERYNRWLFYSDRRGLSTGIRPSVWSDQWKECGASSRCLSSLGNVLMLKLLRDVSDWRKARSCCLYTNGSQQQSCAIEFRCSGGWWAVRYWYWCEKLAAWISRRQKVKPSCHVRWAWKNTRRIPRSWWTGERFCCPPNARGGNAIWRWHTCMCLSSWPGNPVTRSFCRFSGINAFLSHTSQRSIGRKWRTFCDAIPTSTVNPAMIVLLFMTMPLGSPVPDSKALFVAGFHPER